MSNISRADFSSENFAAVHPHFMRALANANTGHVPSYGNDKFTNEAIMLFRQCFGDDITVHFTFNGTGANNFALSCITDRHHAIYCTDVAHLYVDESTSAESLIGARIFPVAAVNGKLEIDSLRKKLKRLGDVHHPQAGVVSITQPTEYGTVYTLEEMKAIKAFCTEYNLLLHVDGARFFNAAAILRTSLKELTTEIGIDALTLGGTKIGLMFGEAVILFKQKSAGKSKFYLKRSMQLASKNRFIAAQFTALLKNDFWRDLAAATNRLARIFETEIHGAAAVRLAYPVETNSVFLHMSKTVYLALQHHAGFYYWNEEKQEARLVFAFDNTLEEVKALARLIKKL